jgi:hypothetical protein
MKTECRKNYLAEKLPPFENNLPPVVTLGKLTGITLRTTEKQHEHKKPSTIPVAACS